MALQEELLRNGYCILRAHLPRTIVTAARDAFWPILLEHLAKHGSEPNRGTARYYLPMPFVPPCCTPEFFFDSAILNLVREALGSRFVADQWGCDVPVLGSEYQEFHVDYQRPLFEEAPDLLLPPHALVVSYSLIDITREHGPIEIAPGTHRMPRESARHAVASGQCETHAVTMEMGDVLVRHPWAVHRGTPNRTSTPRALATIRYVRRWYTDESREVNPIPLGTWESLTQEQQGMMRFPLAP